jgi:hypothetical protein
MKTTPISAALLGALTLCGPSVALAAVTPPAPGVSSQIAAIEQEKAARTPLERKLDSSLHYLVRETAGLKAVDGAPQMTSRVKLEADGRVTVDISAPPSDGLSQAIVAAGGTVVHESATYGSVRAIVPPAALPGLAAREEVKHISKGAERVRHTGAVDNEADAAEKVISSRAKFGVDGTGMKIGVISDSADHSAASVSSGELPADFTILPGKGGNGTGEGTAMSEIVHDLAPGAKIFFAEAGPGKPGFAESITQLRAAGCQIIVDDISYGNEWQFQDDEIGQAINTVTASGALYFSSSGNEGNLKHGNSTTWEGDFADGGVAGDPIAGQETISGHLHSFGAQAYNTLPNGDSGANLQWSDEYHTSANDYDLFALNAAGTAVVASSASGQDGTGEPMESIDTVHQGERIVIWKADAAEPRYLRLSCTGSPLQIQTTGQTIGHAATANCICVASADASAVAPGAFTSASVLDDASSDGPHHMFYNPDGSPITPGNFLASGGVNLQTPAITGGDGGATSVPGFSQFYGTSAAAPASAAITAVIWSRKPTMTNVEMRSLIESSCIDVEAPGFDINSGHGILMADLGLDQTRSPQEIWRDAKFGVVLPTGNAAPGADPDHDGVTNLVEYATGTEPLTPGGSALSGPVAAGATLKVSYHQDLRASDAVISFEHSTDLGSGSWLPLVPVSDTVDSVSAGVELHSATFPKTLTREFFRMKVTAP